jgi:hypothetical protein
MDYKKLVLHPVINFIRSEGIFNLKKNILIGARWASG